MLLEEKNNVSEEDTTVPSPTATTNTRRPMMCGAVNVCGGPRGTTTTTPAAKGGVGGAVATAISAAIKSKSPANNPSNKARFTSKPIELFDEDDNTEIYNDDDDDDDNGAAPTENNLHHHTHQQTHKARRGIIQAILDRATTRFTSKPIHLVEEKQLVLQSFPSLTAGEQEYLEQLLQSDDHDSIRQASLTLADPNVFPPELPKKKRPKDVEEEDEDESSSILVAPTKRDSKVQQHLFRLHQFSNSSSSMGSLNNKPKPAKLSTRGNSILLDSSNHSTKPRIVEKEQPKKLLDENERKNSILESTLSILSLEQEEEDEDSSSFFHMDKFDNNNKDKKESNSNNDDEDDDDNNENNNDNVDKRDSIGPRNVMPWLVEGYREGIEIEEGVDGSTHVTSESREEGGEVECFRTSFAILGTTADDSSCHPHVLSPPLMESLLEFMDLPEDNNVDSSLSSTPNFWIKYSAVRDGPSLMTLLRHVRASTRTILAIETTDGYVFGSYTSSPWRLSSSSSSSSSKSTSSALPTISSSDHNDVDNTATNNTTTQEDAMDDDDDWKNPQSYYGSSTKDSFLWKMRQSRFESQQASTVEQAVMLESELVVFPVTGNNPCVQYCGGGSGNHNNNIGIGLGEECHAIQIDTNLRHGRTGCSETFGNPSLVPTTASSGDTTNSTSRTFEIANLEVWTLTPHDTVKQAQTTELSSLFLLPEEEKQAKNNPRLDLLGLFS